jgi:ribosome-associated protein
MHRITPQSIRSDNETCIEIEKLPIRLGQFLKHADIVQNGLEAKIMIQNGEIFVNGQLESRRGKKLFDGDQISVHGSLYTVHCKK